MATHGCIGNPCWICHPEYAPRTVAARAELRMWARDRLSKLMPDGAIYQTDPKDWSEGTYAMVLPPCPERRDEMPRDGEWVGE